MLVYLFLIKDYVLMVVWIDKYVFIYLFIEEKNGD